MRIGYVLVFGFVLASSSAARADHHHHRSSKKTAKPAATAPPPVDTTERVPVVFHPTSLLYPVGPTTLEVARDRDIAVLDAVMKKSAADRVIVIAMQKKPDTTAPLPTVADVAPIGVVAKISKVERKSDKVATLTYEPIARARITAITGGDKTAMLAAIERAPSTGKLSAERVNALGDWMDRYEKQFAGRVTLPVRSSYPDDAQFVDAIAKSVLVEHLDDTNRAALLAEPDVDLRAAELLKDVTAHTPPPPPTKGKGKQKK